METEIKNCLEILREGKTILYPTDTVWGLGCDATNETAIKKIYAIKQREESKSLILLVNNDAMLNRYVEDVPSIAWDLMDYSTKPITIIYPQAKNLPKSLIAEDGSIAIRKTDHPFCNKLIEQLKKPLVSTSANISGEPTPKTFSAISNRILEGVDYVVNLPDTNRKSIPSSLVKVGLGGEIEIIRK